jgi:hypothetical protein
MTGRMVMAEGMEAPFTLVFQRPLKSRMEVTVQDMTRIQAFDGKTGWVVVPFAESSEPQILEEEFLPMMREQSDFTGPLIDWEAKGHLVELVDSTETAEGGAYHLKVTLDSGAVRHYFLSKETNLPVRIEATTEFMGDELEVETSLGDFRPVGDVLMAHSIRTGPKGAPEGQALEIETIEINVDVADALFSLPGSTSEAEQDDTQD